LFSPNIASCFQFATSIEILANSWYVHGDVQSGITERNGAASVWWTWGPAQSINTGDGLHALARLSILENKSGFSNEVILKALSIFDSSYLTLCEGENLDINYQESPLVKEDDFMKMLQKRAGSLISCAFQFGYLGSKKRIQDIDEKHLIILKELGEMSGIIRELTSQNLILSSNSTLPPEIFHRFSSKNKNIFTTFLLNNADASTKRRIGEIYLKRVLENNDLDVIKEVIINSNYDDYFNNIMSNLKSNASDLIDKLSLSKDQLNKLSEIVIGDESF